LPTGKGFKVSNDDEGKNRNAQLKGSPEGVAEFATERPDVFSGGRKAHQRRAPAKRQKTRKRKQKS